MNISVNPKAKRLRNAKKPQISQAGSSRGSMTLYRQISLNTSVLRKLTAQSVISTNGSAIVGLNTIYTGGVTSLGTLWSNIAQEFQTFRVRSMRLHLKPAYNVSYAIFGTNTYTSNAILFGRYWDVVPSSTQSLQQSPQLMILSTAKEHVISTNYMNFPNAQLWTDTTAALAADKLYGFAYCSIGTTGLEPSAAVFYVYTEYDIEFVGAL